MNGNSLSDERSATIGTCARSVNNRLGPVREKKQWIPGDEEDRPVSGRKTQAISRYFMELPVSLNRASRIEEHLPSSRRGKYV